MFRVNLEKVQAEFVNDYASIQAERERAILQAETDANAEVQNAAEYAELLEKQEQERAELVERYIVGKKEQVAALFNERLAVYEKYVERVEEENTESEGE